MMMYSGKLNIWNATHALSYIHDFTSLSSSPSSLMTPFTLFLSVSLSAPPPVKQEVTVLGSTSYAGATRATGSGRALACFPRDMKGWYMCRIVRERETERSESHLFECECWADKRFKNLQHRQEQRLLGNRDWVTDYWDPAETKYWKQPFILRDNKMSHPDK